MSVPVDVFREGDMVIRIIVLWIKHHRIINYDLKRFLSRSRRRFFKKWQAEELLD